MFTIYRTLHSKDAPEPHVIYPSSLSVLGQGYALWFPEPHETGEPRIGDVGYIRQGAFIRLFNIKSSVSEHKVTHWPVQYEIAETLQLPSDVFHVDKRHAPIGPGSLRSHGVRERELQGEITAGPSADTGVTLAAGHTCREVQGALLVLKTEAYSESLYENRRVQAYMVQHHDSWCAYARETINLRIKAENVVLISGWVKAPADWAAAAFSNTHRRYELSLKGQVGRLFGMQLSGSRSRTHSGPEMQRQGARYPKTAGKSAKKDQCVFIKRYMIRKRLGIVRELVAGAGYDELPGDREPDSGTAAPVIDAKSPKIQDKSLFAEDRGTVIDPLEILLDYILEVSEAECAIARDEDVETVLGGDACPADFSTYLRKQQPPIIVENSYGTVSPSAILDREWSTLENRIIKATDLRKWPNISEERSSDLATLRIQLPSSERPGDREVTKFPFLSFTNSATAGDVATHAFALSGDGKLLAASWRTREISVWRTSDGLTVQQLAGRSEHHTNTTTALAFSPDGTRLVSGSKDGTAIVWKVATREAILRLRGHIDSVASVAFLPDGQRIMTGGFDRTVKFWDARTGHCLCSFPVPYPVVKLVISPDASRAAAMLEGAVALYNIGTPIVQCGTIRIRNTSDMRTVSFSPNGDRVLLCAEGLVGRVYGTEDCREIIRLDQQDREILAGAFSPDGTGIASVLLNNNRGMMCLQDASHATVTFQGRIVSRGTAVAFSPDGALLAASGDIEIVVWNAKSGEFIARMPNVPPKITDLIFLPGQSKAVVRTSRGGYGHMERRRYSAHTEIEWV